MNSSLENIVKRSGRQISIPAQGYGNRASGLLARIVLLALAALTMNASAQDTAYPAASSVLQPQAYVSLQPVPRGRAFEIAVVAKISPGFHINAHVPSEDYLIPTKITADLAPGVFLVETAYPRGVMRAFRFRRRRCAFTKARSR